MQRPTLIEFDDGPPIEARVISYGRDPGEEWEHLYVDDIGGGVTLFVKTSDIRRLLDPETGALLYSSRD